MKHEEAARKFAEALRKIASDENKLDNLESYLSYHFAAWLEKYANTPDSMAAELECFANIDF